MIGGSGGTPWSDPMRGGAAVTFNEALSQTIAMLQQHGRVSYRALKRQFAIDDAFLEDLKYELIAVQSAPSTRMTPCWCGRGKLVQPQRPFQPQRRPPPCLP